MTNIIDFFIRHKNSLLFIFLLLLSLGLTLQSHSYQKSKFVSSTNSVVGGIHAFRSGIDDYFHLKSTNQNLLEENKQLRQQLLNFSWDSHKIVLPDTTGFYANYIVRKAKVISNQYAKSDNYILIDKGKADSIKVEQGVITDKGIVGVVEETSENYARIISILNSNLAINAQLKKSEHFGTLSWNGKNPNVVQLSDIPRLADVKQGDTIITNGRSLIFPKGIPIGVVENFDLDDGQNYYVLDVKLFNDMSDIGYVYIIENTSRMEIRAIMKTDEH